MSDAKGPETPARVEPHDELADILRVLAKVGAGDYSSRLDPGLPATHPLGALCAGINEMIASLDAEKQRSEAYRRELEDKLAMIDRQRRAIGALSTPIIEVWAGVLCLPVVGILDSARSADMTDALLQCVMTNKSRCVIIDITGIEVMDTRTIDHFVQMTTAVRLLGAECVLTGINPQIARTVVQMGVDLAGVRTYRRLREALRSFLGRRRARR